MSLNRFVGSGEQGVREGVDSGIHVRTRFDLSGSYRHGGDARLNKHGVRKYSGAGSIIRRSAVIMRERVPRVLKIGLGSNRVA